MIKINNLRFTYTQRSVPAVDGVTLSIGRGEFVTVCGPSGCGKSTLLRHLKPTLMPSGEVSGSVTFDGVDVKSLTPREESERIGFVMQSPEDQLVCDKVWHELAFGLENLGLPSAEIRARVAETAEYFGISDKFGANVTELSGGQKQLVNLAAVMVMRPEVLILDEPTSQLDPIAAAEYLAAIGRLNRELGTTVILVEHRLEDAFALSSRVVVMDSGRIVADCAPDRLGEVMPRELYGFMPTASRVWRALPDADGTMPISVRDGREFLSRYLKTHTPRELPAKPSDRGDVMLSARELCYRYEPTSPEVVKGLSLEAFRGELVAILGGNGSGKSTAMSLLAGVNKPQSGDVTASGRVVLLPQEPSALFCKQTVREELCEISDDYGGVVSLCRLDGLLDSHPFDLSGGEKQRAALAKVLLCKPDILLVDEPTKGMDSGFKRQLAEIFTELRRDGKAIIMVSHDAEFCAENADRCALFFDGTIVSQASPRDFFTATSYYTTAAARMTRGLVPCVTADELIWRLGGDVTLPEPTVIKKQSPAAAPDVRTPQSRHKKITPFSVAAVIVMLIIIPLTVWFGGEFFGSRRYYLTSLLVAGETLVVFALMLEGRRPRARELAVIASLCAIGVAGRAVFFMVPECKPVVAITIVAGAALGGGRGFTVGAMTMLVSNLIFGQGPWTPWQMLAMGLVGLIAGAVFRLIKASRISLCVYGVIAAVVIYGGIMNPASALLWAESPTLEMLAAYYVSGFPLDCVRAAATAVFLAFAGMPMMEKLERVRIKYGI